MSEQGTPSTAPKSRRRPTLRARLAAYIAATVAPGDRLPPTKTLAEQLGAHPANVNRELRALVPGVVSHYSGSQAWYRADPVDRRGSVLDAMLREVVAASLRRGIHSGRYPARSLLPSIRKLQRGIVDTSRRTVWAAVTTVRDEGLVESARPRSCPTVVGEDAPGRVRLRARMVVGGQIRDRIAQGVWAPGQALPDMAALAAVCEATPDVVADAMVDLRAEGYVVRARGGEGFLVAPEVCHGAGGDVD